MNEQLEHARGNEDRSAGIALIAGAIGTIVTMSLHPRFHDQKTPEEIAALAHASAHAHSLALASMPILFFGALGLARRLAAPGKLATFALVVYGYALVAVLGAATVSGFIAPDLIRIQSGAAPAEAGAWRAALELAAMMIHSFARVFNVAASGAIGIWSIEILRRGQLPRSLGIFGVLLAPALVLVIVSGHLHLDVHGEGVIVILQAVWFAIAGVLLLRSKAS